MFSQGFLPLSALAASRGTLKNPSVFAFFRCSGPIFSSFSLYFGLLGCTGAPQGLSGPSWDLLGVLCGHCGALWGALGDSWAPPGPSLGPSWTPLGALLVPFGLLEAGPVADTPDRTTIAVTRLLKCRRRCMRASMLQ